MVSAEMKNSEELLSAEGIFLYREGISGHALFSLDW